MNEEWVHGIKLVRGFFTLGEQRTLIEDLRAVAMRAPPFHPMTPRGLSMSVKITAAGRYCWYSDRKGYRYVDAHPETGAPFPPIPDLVLRAWQQFETRGDPDCCLINHYAENTRMGLHRDEDEADFSFPVVSISLGDPALFRVALGEERTPTKSFWLETGDVMALSGERRLAYHGVDRIKFGETALLAQGGRLNVTLRRVAPG